MLVKTSIEYAALVGTVSTLLLLSQTSDPSNMTLVFSPLTSWSMFSYKKKTQCFYIIAT